MRDLVAYAQTYLMRVFWGRDLNHIWTFSSGKHAKDALQNEQQIAYKCKKSKHDKKRIKVKKKQRKITKQVKNILQNCLKPVFQ